MHILFREHFEVNHKTPLHTSAVSLRYERYNEFSSSHRLFATIINKVDGHALSKDGRCSWTFIGEGTTFIEAIIHLCSKVSEYADDNVCEQTKSLIITGIANECEKYLINLNKGSKHKNKEGSAYDKHQHQ